MVAFELHSFSHEQLNLR